MLDRSLVLVAAASLPALVVLVVNVHAALKLMVNAGMFLDVVERLLREGHRERAHRLGKTLPVPVVELTRFALELRLPRFEMARGAGDYRDAAPSDLAERAKAALEAQARVQLRRLLPGVFVAPLALLSPSVLLADVPDSSVSVVLVVSAVGLLCAVLNVRRHGRVKRQLADVVLRLTPWVLPE